MSTNAFINVKIEGRDCYYVVYLHWDGDMAGSILREHYNDYDSAVELVTNGDISSLGKLISPPEGVPHSFNNPAPDVTVFYQRDRNDGGSRVRIKNKPVRDCYSYTFEDGEWRG